MNGPLLVSLMPPEKFMDSTGRYDPVQATVPAHGTVLRDCRKKIFRERRKK